jgi:hypothetical protein
LQGLSSLEPKVAAGVNIVFQSLLISLRQEMSFEIATWTRVKEKGNFYKTEEYKKGG